MSNAAKQPDETAVTETVEAVPQAIALGNEPGSDLVEGDRDRKLEPIVQPTDNREPVRNPLVIEAEPKTEPKDDDRTPKNTNITPN